MTAETITEAAILHALRIVEDPDLHKDIVTLGFVKNLRICGGSVALDVELTTPACPVKDQMRDFTGFETGSVVTERQVRAVESNFNLQLGL